MRKILPFFSYLFHPLFIPFMAIVVFFYFNNIKFFSRESYFVLFQIGIVTILVPVLFFFLLRSIGKINSIMVADISQRKIPLIIQCFLIIILIRNTITINSYPELHFFFLGNLLGTLSALMLLFFNTKASLHMMALSALTLFVVALNIRFQNQTIYLVAFLLLMNGLVATSRLEMKAHTFKELLLGLIIGALPQLFLSILWL